MTDWHPAIASTVANHYIESEAFQREQAAAMAKVLMDIIEALGIPPDPSPTTDEDPLLFGSWRASRVLAAVPTSGPSPLKSVLEVMPILQEDVEDLYGGVPPKGRKVL